MNTCPPLAIITSSPPMRPIQAAGSDADIIRLPRMPNLRLAGSQPSTSHRDSPSRSPSHGIPVIVFLRRSQESESLVDQVLEAGFDVSSEHDASRMEALLVVDMQSRDSLAAMERVANEVPSVRMLALADSWEREQDAWNAHAHVVARLPVNPEIVVRLLTRCAAEIEREKLVHDLSGKVRTLRARLQERAASSPPSAGRPLQRALTTATFQAHLLADSISTNGDSTSVPAKLSRDLCASLTHALDAVTRPRRECVPDPVSLELHRIVEVLRRGTHAPASALGILRKR